MRIRTKLLAAIFCPLLAMAALAAWAVRDQWVVADEMNDVQRLTSFAANVSVLVHETQKERGATAGFLGGGGDFAKRLEDQRELTDTRVEQLRGFLAGGFDPDSYGPQFAEQVRRGLDELDKLAETRRAISAGELKAAQAIGYYTRMNGDLLNAVGRSSLATTDGEIAVRINAYTSFLKMKERAGIERAVLSNTFAKDRFGPGMYDKFVSLVALQNAYGQDFLNLASPTARETYEQTLASPVVARVEELRGVATRHAETGGFGVDAGEWFDTITKKINLLKQVDDQLAAFLLEEAGAKARAATASLSAIAGSVAVVFALVSAGGWIAVRSVLQRIKSVRRRVQEIADGDGDLTQRLTVNRDELGELSHWFNTLMEKIEGVIVRIADTSAALAASSSQLRRTAGSLMEGANESKQRSMSIAAAAEQMSTNMQHTAASTEEMSVGIATVSEALESIQTAIEEIEQHSAQSAAMAQSAAERVEGGNAQVSQLGSAAQEIGDVMDVIQDIAEQTNLLALNATIEAARAGEAGKGFAVVATEVKELAKQTAQATEGIRQRVVSMQDCTRSTVDVIADIDKVIEEINGVVGTISDSITRQSQSVMTITSNMHQSSAATKEVASGVSDSASASKDVTRNVTDIDQRMADALTRAEEANAVGESVASLAQALQAEVRLFKTRKADTTTAA